MGVSGRPGAGEKDETGRRDRRTAARGALGGAEVEARLDAAFGVRVLMREDALAVDNEVGEA